jgi:peptidoglycan/LPS O-acetylase OafA/YrhL
MRNLGLDLLRFLAILLVIGRHLPLPVSSPFLLSSWHCGGWVGVDLFFVLSGFLVSGILFREHQKTGRLDLKRFLIRRGLKIYPAFWALIGITLLVATASPQRLPLTRVVSELLFVQNYSDGLWNHTWSLAVEEHFYFALALLFVGLIAWRPQNSFAVLPRLFLSIALICFGFRLLSLWVFPVYSHRWYLFATHLRIDSLFFGVLLSYWHHYARLPGWIRATPVRLLIECGLLLLLPAFLFPLERYKWVSVAGVILFYLGSGSLLLGAIRLERSSNRFLLLLGALGSASYSVYLWHMPVNVWGTSLIQEALGHHSYPLFFLACLVGSFTFGYFMSRLIERPALQIRDRLFPSRNGKNNWQNRENVLHTLATTPTSERCCPFSPPVSGSSGTDIPTKAATTG